MTSELHLQEEAALSAAFQMLIQASCTILSGLLTVASGLFSLLAGLFTIGLGLLSLFLWAARVLQARVQRGIVCVEEWRVAAAARPFRGDDDETI